MSAEKVSRLVLDYLDALLARGDFARFYSEQVTFGVPTVGWSTQGREAVERAIRHHYEVEFDSRPEVLNVVAGESGAAAELIFAGPNIGVLAGNPPTGNVVRIPIGLFIDVDSEAGQIAGLRVYYDRDQFLQQVRDGVREPDHATG
ncbi:MAG: nuclear transport factor 2 family protein [Actinomycetota bacterium]|nr:nuclear transport factor 2 family protein [Actinomycetota bacterium]